MFVRGKFLLLPEAETILEKGVLSVSEQCLQAAYDVTPDLPVIVLENAWRHRIVFPNEVEAKWAQDIARVVPGLSAKDIIVAFRGR